MTAGAANSPATSALRSSSGSAWALRRSSRRTRAGGECSVTVCSAVAGLDMNAPSNVDLVLSKKCRKPYGAGQRSTAMPLEYPSLIWIAAPEVIRGARLVANGTRIEANGNTWAFDVVPKIALNRSYYDQTSIAFLGMQPLTIRGWLQQETFVARTIWPEAFRLDDCAPSRHVDATAQGIRRPVREESAGRARSAFAAMTLGEREPGAARRWEEV